MFYDSVNFGLLIQYSVFKDQSIERIDLSKLNKEVNLVGSVIIP